MNSRITKKERALVKGSLRRVFSRSELRRSIVDAAMIEGYSDPSRPRVKRWFRCAMCGKPEAVSYAQVDHILPIKEIESLTDDYESWDNIIDKLWCDPSNLQALCKEPCHIGKSKAENKLRREYKKKVKDRNE